MFRTDDHFARHRTWCRKVGIPLLKQARDQSIGARRENLHFFTKSYFVAGNAFPPHHHTSAGARDMNTLVGEEWGPGSDEFVESLRVMSFARHHVVGRKTAFGTK